MSKKLLVITAGTVAAGVGQTILRQMKAHPGSELNVMVRYIDTAFLPSRYGSIRPNEWFQMSIDPRYMRALYSNISAYPNLERMLFEKLLPGTDVSGGGSIRYNGAGAVEVKRDDLRKWLSASMTTLAQSGDASTNISIALIVSAVGATGSGSLEHLIDVIVDAAHFAGVRSTAQSTIRCDTYILQPSQDVTDLGLANTVALYTELAASQLSRTDTNTRTYQGRKILIGWGSDRALASIEQLKEVAATIVRLSSDPASAFAAEFQEREVDNHVLRELDHLTNLPSHLSLVTVVTINLGRLEEQVIQRDVTRLVNSLVFDAATATNQANVLLGKFADVLAGERAEDRYQKLIEYLSDVVSWSSMRSRLDATVSSKGIPTGEKGPRLMGLWQEYKEEIKQGRHRIHDFASSFASSAIRQLASIKGERICRGNISLTTLREEYRALHAILIAVLDVAREDTRTTVSDTPVLRQQKALEGLWPFRLFNRMTKLRRLASAMRRNLEEYLQQSTRSSAIDVLERLEQHCAEIGRDLDVVLNKLRRQRDEEQRLTLTTGGFSVDTANPLNMVALSNADEMTTYAAQVSIFSAHAQDVDQLAEFRQWLQGRAELEALFKGNLDLLLGVVTRYVKEKVREAMQKHSVVDVLRRAGEDTLLRRLSEASARATALVKYSEDFAHERREAWHVSAYYRNEEQRDEIQRAINEAFAQGQCKLLSSSDPAELAVFYYVDGIPMSAIGDLKGRCLDAFLKRRQQWYKQKAALNGNAPAASMDSFNQRVGVPIFSGRDAEQRALDACVIKRLYDVKGPEVGDYDAQDIPELKCAPVPQPSLEQANHHQNNGAQTLIQTTESGQIAD